MDVIAYSDAGVFGCKIVEFPSTMTVDDAIALEVPSGSRRVVIDKASLPDVPPRWMKIVGSAVVEASDAEKAANPPIMPPVQTISDRQFFQQLALTMVITQDEALAAVKTGAMPASMEALIDALPTNQQFSARMLLSGATTFDRNNPLTEQFALMYGWTTADLDAFWAAAAAL